MRQNQLRKNLRRNTVALKIVLILNGLAPNKMNQKVIPWIGLFAGFPIIALSIAAMIRYPGSFWVYLIFTLISHLLLVFAFRPNRIFFDTFIGMFLWIGFWLKFSFRLVFKQSQFIESVGHFNFSPIAFDHALLISSIGIAGILVSSVLRSFVFSYSKQSLAPKFHGLIRASKSHRRTLWTAFIFAFVTLAIINVTFGVYQRGCVTHTHFPFGLNGLVTWLLLFGLASVSCALMACEIYLDQKLFWFGFIAFLETFFSSTSMMSRAMVVNAGTLLIGFWTQAAFWKKQLSSTLLARWLVVLGVLFVGSVLSVNYFRPILFAGDSFVLSSARLHDSMNKSSGLIIDRWVGMEGMLAVSSYPDLGWDLWKSAWAEKYQDAGTSFYDAKIIRSWYVDTDLIKHHFVSLPGILAFFYYPGSELFLFCSMAVLGLFAALIEWATFKLSGSNLIFSCLISEVLAYRYVHFGYAPAHSYQLLGSLAFTVLLVYFVNLALERFIPAGNEVVSPITCSSF